MAKIRHLAIKTPNPQRLAEFYESAFGMEVLLRADGGAVYMTDGYLTLALLQSRPEDAPPGINHFGIAVEDANAACRKLVELGVPLPTVRPSNRPYAELRGMDPDGNLFDISQHGYEEEEYLPEREAAQKKNEKVD
jgi:catechol 2,3-dioxygenase-like lactoylglutathione lyase family enzyme